MEYGKEMNRQDVDAAIANPPKKGLARLFEAVKSCPKTIKALAAKSKKDEAEREKQGKKDRRRDFLCL